MLLQKRGALLTGLGAGVGLMYFLDPERGRRRRAIIRDRIVHSAHASAGAMGATGRDLSHRAKGTASRMLATFRHESVDDVVVVERVRAQLGRLVSHPRAIEVDAVDGIVTLRGPVLRAEVPRLVSGVRRIRGVRDVVNRTEEHSEPGRVPALQSGQPSTVGASPS